MGRQIKRGHKKRKARKTILLVTNGAKTEYRYLSGLVRRCGESKQLRDAVSPRVESIEGDPLEVLRKVTNPKADSRDYEEVWIVVDHDGEDREEFLRRCDNKSTRRQKIVGIVSVPCFEVWLNAHYEQVRKYQNQKEAQSRYRELTGLTSKERKGLLSDFPWDRIEDACKRSRLSGVELPDLNTQGPCPSTTMPHLIRALGMLRPGAEL